MRAQLTIGFRAKTAERSRFADLARALWLGLLLSVAGAASAESIFTQQAYMKASNRNDNDYYGSSVAIDRDVAVVGAPLEAGSAVGVNGDEGNGTYLSGAAYIYFRSGGIWTQEAYVKASNTGRGDVFGSDVAVSGDTVVVGAPGEGSGVSGNQADDSAEEAGAVYVFVKRDGVWSQQAYLKASNAQAGDRFGDAVALSGDTLVVGARAEASSSRGVDSDQSDNSDPWSGAVYVFRRIGDEWLQEAYLKPLTKPDGFGSDVAVSGSTVLVGGSDDSMGRNSGAAYVFVKEESGWGQQAFLKASNAEESDGFGGSVAIDRDTIVVGARYEKSAATGVNGDQSDNSISLSGGGAAYVFQRTGDEWQQEAYLKPPGSGYFWVGSSFRGSSFAYGVGLAAGTIVVSEKLTRQLHVFGREGGQWVLQQSFGGTVERSGDTFGESVAISGVSIIAGNWSDRTTARGVNGAVSLAADFDGSFIGSAFVFQSGPFSIRSMERGSGGTRFTVPPAFGSHVGLEYSPDLSAGSWIDLGNFFEGFYEFEFIDPDEVRAVDRSGYYRAFLRPVTP